MTVAKGGALHCGPSTGPADSVPSEQLLPIGVADVGVDVVVVEHSTIGRVGHDTPVSLAVAKGSGKAGTYCPPGP